jgi:hypothetical protein
VDESVKGVKYCTVCQELSMTVCDQRRFQVYSMYGFGPDATRWIGRLVPVLCAEGAVHLPDPAVGVRSVWIHWTVILRTEWAKSMLCYMFSGRRRHDSKVLDNLVEPII